MSEEEAIDYRRRRAKEDALRLFHEVLENISNYQSELALDVNYKTIFKERFQDRDTKRLEKLVTAD